MERIAKFIAHTGLCSRREAEKLIEQGIIKINGATVTHPSTLVSDSDEVEIKGKRIYKPEKTRVWIFYKPLGYVTTHRDPQERLTVFDYLKENFPKLPRVISVGRLDLNSEGLLLLTNNGEFSRMAELPATGWKRAYRVRAYGEINPYMIDQAKNGLHVNGIHYKSIKIDIERSGSNNHWFFVELIEGKNREIRKVFDFFGLKVNRLIRVAYGPYTLQHLKSGEILEVDVRKSSSF